MSAEVKLMTAEELLEMPDDGFRYELIEGELKQMSPAGHEHGKIASRLDRRLGVQVEKTRSGEVYAAETGFKLQTAPDIVRAPDAAFVRQERVAEVSGTTGYFPGAPDLAVEVVSPGDKVSEVEDKVETWLKFGTSLVWVVSPRLRTVTVYRSRTDITTLTEGDTLDGGDVVPDFRCAVAELFD